MGLGLRLKRAISQPLKHGAAELVKAPSSAYDSYHHNARELIGSKAGSVLSGRAVKEGGTYELTDDEKAGIQPRDILTSPATAGTNQQTAALYVPAVGYAAYAGYSALGAGSSSSSAPSSTTPSATSSNNPVFARAASRMAGGMGGGGGEYTSEMDDYNQQQDEETRYWTERAMALRDMADRAVRRYVE